MSGKSREAMIEIRERNRKIVRLLDAGYERKDIGLRYGIAPYTIYEILRKHREGLDERYKI